MTSGSRTSPRRYSIFVQPYAAGSNGRRAMPTTRATRASAWSRGIRPNPKVPVGPVTATVRCPSRPDGKIGYRRDRPGSQLRQCQARAGLTAVLASRSQSGQLFASGATGPPLSESPPRRIAQRIPCRGYPRRWCAPADPAATSTAVQKVADSIRRRSRRPPITAPGLGSRWRHVRRLVGAGTGPPAGRASPAGRRAAGCSGPKSQHAGRLTGASRNPRSLRF